MWIFVESGIHCKRRRTRTAEIDVHMWKLMVIVPHLTLASETRTPRQEAPRSTSAIAQVERKCPGRILVESAILPVNTFLIFRDNPWAERSRAR